MRISSFAVVLMVSLNFPVWAAPNCESAATDTNGDGWGYENNVSCRVVDAEVEGYARTGGIGRPLGSAPIEGLLAASGNYAFAIDGAALRIANEFEPDRWLESQSIDLTDGYAGCSADIDGEIAVVGSCLNGAAAIYRLQSDGQWQLEATIEADDPYDGVAGSYYHASTVSVSGDTVVIGSKGWPYYPAGSDGARVEVYRHYSGGNWVNEATIKGTNQIKGFADSVALADFETLLVGKAIPDVIDECFSGSSCGGAQAAREARARNGGVGIYQRQSDGGWVFTGNMSTDGFSGYTDIGTLVIASVDTAVVSATSNEEPVLLISNRDGNSWTVTQELAVTAPDPIVRMNDFASIVTVATTTDDVVTAFYLDETRTSFTQIDGITTIAAQHGLLRDRILGVEFGQINVFQPTYQCYDADGDGTGWNGVTSCSVLPTLTPFEPEFPDMCIDTDGDGWGWDGQASCVPDMTETTTPSQPTYCDSPSSDSDGDGWGWENDQSCIVR